MRDYGADMNKVLSISIAAYNIEKYLDKLMNSLLDERVTDALDIMIVSDGSTDNTISMGEKYSAKYPGTVRVIAKENGGHGSTINKGIELAEGKYFKPIDGDDWVDTEALVKFVRFLEDHDADMVISDYKRCVEGSEPEDVVFSGIEAGRVYSFEDMSAAAGWMRYHTVTFRTSILRDHGVRLDEHCFYVDTELMVMPIPYVETATYCDACVYCYRLGINEQSVSMTSRKKHIDNSEKVSETLLDYFNSLDVKLSDRKNAYMLDGILSICLWHFETLIIAFEPSWDVKKRIIAFDKMVLDKNPVIYKMMQDSTKAIKMLRSSKYAAYGQIARFRRRKYEKEHAAG